MMIFFATMPPARSAAAQIFLPYMVCYKIDTHATYAIACYYYVAGYQYAITPLAAAAMLAMLAAAAEATRAIFGHFTVIFLIA